MPQTLNGHVDMVGLEGGKQVNILCPAASQEVIKQLGTNGGGIYNANSAHPYENPNAFTNLIEEIEMNTLGYACVFAFGIVAMAKKDARAIVAVMALFIFACASIVYWAETQPAPALHAVHAVAQVNMEGKEVRFGAPSTATWTAFTTGASDGGVIAMHDSYMPLAGGAAMFMIQLGEILPGGVGSGLYGMMVMAIIAVFVAGLMVGRTPEYLGKKIEAREVKFAMLPLLIFPLSVLGFAAVACLAPWAHLERRSPIPARTDCRRSSTPTPRRPGTTARPSPASTPTSPTGTRPSASRCCSAASPSPCRCWPWRARSPPSPNCRRPAAPSPPMGRSSSACWWA